MPLPQPSVSLTGACSVIYNNKLYAFSQAAFQSLALEDGAEWETLSGGQSVEGGVCVGSTPKDPAAAGLFIVGGKSTDAGYQGLQKFTYSTGKWESIKLTSAITQSRVWHGATYLNGSDSILVYAGSQDGSTNPSSQTFTIKASGDHGVESFGSTAVPPAVEPIILPWSETKAVMIGGDAGNTRVMLFDPAVPTNPWVDSGTTLAEPITKKKNQLQAVLVSGDDGSKHLYTFDLSTSPNVVQRTILAGAGGAPVSKSAPIKESPDKPPSKRDLSVTGWPAYNSTLAPKATRDGFSLAADTNGLVVMSGGNDDDVLCMFDGSRNCWYNATARLSSKDFQVSSESSTTLTATATSTSTTMSTSITTTSAMVTSTTSAPATSTTAAAAAAAPASSSDSTGLSPQAILGIALGSIFGAALVLVALLLCLKRRRQRQNYVDQGHARRDSGLPDQKAPMPHDMAQASGGYFRGHGQQESAGSFSSMAILMGKVQKPPIQRKGSNGTRRSSASSIVNKQFKSTIGRPHLQVTPEPSFEPREEKGISFAENANQPKPRTGPVTTRDGERRSSGWNRYWSGGSTLNVLGFGSGSRRETTTSEQSSHYSDRHRMTQDSATVPPLHVEGRPEFNRVNSGSPTVAHFATRHREMSAQLERPVSPVSSSGYSSGIPPSVSEAWDPTMAKEPWGSNRAPSDAYTGSNYTGGGAGKSRPPTGVSQQPQLAMASTSTDMSWLNLGEQQRQQPYR